MPRLVKLFHQDLSHQQDLNDQWCRENPGLCPVCHGVQTDRKEGISLTVDGYGYQGTVCLSCGASWEEEYRLNGLHGIFEYDEKEAEIYERHIQHSCIVPRRYAGE